MTERKLRLARDAIKDMREVERSSLRQWGLDQTATYLAELRATFVRLCRHPEHGRKRDDLQDGNRSYFVGKHIIIYRFDQSNLYVLAVMHERMDSKKRF